MQKNIKRETILLFVTLLLVILFVAFRTSIMLTSFDFENLFFKNNLFATIMYIGILLVCVALFFLARSTEFYASKTSILQKICNFVLGISFVFLFINELFSASDLTLIDTITRYVSLVASILSIAFYLLSALFDKQTSNGLIKALNLSPVIYLISEFISVFISTSSKANSYYRFPEIISDLILSFFILYLAKAEIVDEEEKVSLFPLSLITIIILSFSIIPDCILMITKNVSANAEQIVVTVIKLVYIILATNTSISHIKKEN